MKRITRDTCKCGERGCCKPDNDRILLYEFLSSIPIPILSSVFWVLANRHRLDGVFGSQDKEGGFLDFFRDFLSATWGREILFSLVLSASILAIHLTVRSVVNDAYALETTNGLSIFWLLFIIYFSYKCNNETQDRIFNSVMSLVVASLGFILTINEKQSWLYRLLDNEIYGKYRGLATLITSFHTLSPTKSIVGVQYIKPFLSSLFNIVFLITIVYPAFQKQETVVYEHYKELLVFLGFVTLAVFNKGIDSIHNMILGDSKTQLKANRDTFASFIILHAIYLFGRSTFYGVQYTRQLILRKGFDGFDKVGWVTGSFIGYIIWIGLQVGVISEKNMIPDLFSLKPSVLVKNTLKQSIRVMTSIFLYAIFEGTLIQFIFRNFEPSVLSRLSVMFVIYSLLVGWIDTRLNPSIKSFLDFFRLRSRSSDPLSAAIYGTITVLILGLCTLTLGIEIWRDIGGDEDDAEENKTNLFNDSMIGYLTISTFIQLSNRLKLLISLPGWTDSASAFSVLSLGLTSTFAVLRPTLNKYLNESASVRLNLISNLIAFIIFIIRLV